MKSLLLVFILLSSIPTLLGADRYVAPGGSDTNPGTLAQPWLTIQHAADAATPGTNIYVRAGTYAEHVTINVSGSAAGGYITLQNYASEVPILDGALITVPAADNGMFLLIDRSYVIIRGFEIRNYKTATKNRVPIGISVRGASHHIELRNNDVHNIETNYTGSSGGDAHGIAVYGTSSTQSIHDIIIDGNKLHDLKLGSSESLVLNGNVELFQVTNNVVHDNNNIGIDCIGFEGTASDATVDQARNGVVRANTVYNIDSYGNPAYGTDRSAGGIYVDGGRDIVIERNIVHNANIGIELASEHAGRATSGITARDNFVYENDIGGIFIGGYDTKRGSTENCLLTNNTLYHNDTRQDGNGEFYVQFDTRNNTFKHNIVVANAQNVLIGNPYTQNTGNVVDWNLYFCPGGAAGSEWQWKNVSKTSFASWKTASGNDAHSLFVDPALVNAAAHDLHLLTTSPAIDAGDPAFTPGSGETDIDGAARVTGPKIDLGADELAPADHWKVEKFGPAGAASPSAADSADPDRDSACNLAEYAFAMDPLRASTTGLPTIVPGDHLAISFQRVLTASDLTLTVQVASNAAGPWDNGSTYNTAGDVPANAFTTEVSRTGSTVQTIVVRDNTATSAAHSRFIRIGITRN